MDQQQHKTETEARSLKDGLLVFADRMKAAMDQYPNEQYQRRLKHWHYKDFPAMTRGGLRTERLYYRRSMASFLTARGAGTNFRERERIARKAQRWARNFAACPKGERYAILAAMLEAERDRPSPAMMLQTVPSPSMLEPRSHTS